MTLSKTRVVLNTKLKEHLDIDGISLCSEDEDGSDSKSENSDEETQALMTQVYALKAMKKGMKLQKLLVLYQL